MNKNIASDRMAVIEPQIASLLIGVRRTKGVDARKVADLVNSIDGLATELQSVEMVPKEMVGTLWYAFTALIAESEHTTEPEPILTAAWEIKEHLRRIFGPLANPR
jgi:hypothetical protein